MWELIDSFLAYIYSLVQKSLVWPFCIGLWSFHYCVLLSNSIVVIILVKTETEHWAHFCPLYVHCTIVFYFLFSSHSTTGKTKLELASLGYYVLLGNEYRYVKISLGYWYIDIIKILSTSYIKWKKHEILQCIGSVSSYLYEHQVVKQYVERLEPLSVLAIDGNI